MRICVAIDAAKVTHRAVAVDDPDAVDRLVGEIRALGQEMAIGLVVVGAFARFLEAVLLVEGVALVHTPGIAVNRAGPRFSAGGRKSDARDARTIADLMSTRDLRRILPHDDTRVALRLGVGWQRELIRNQTRRISLLRGLLCGIHPGLERTLGLSRKGAMALLARHVTPAEIGRAGQSSLLAHLRKTPQLRGPGGLVERAPETGRAQKIVVTDEAPRNAPIRDVAASPRSLGPLAQHWRPLEARQKIVCIDRDLEALLAGSPDGARIPSRPGMGAGLVTEFVACAGDIWRFASTDALASAAGLATVQRPSGKRAGWRRAYGGDKALKRFCYQNAFGAVTTADPLSPGFHDRKRRKGKHHTQPLVALARRRVTAIWTVLQCREAFDPGHKAA